MAEVRRDRALSRRNVPITYFGIFPAGWFSDGPNGLYFDFVFYGV